MSGGAVAEQCLRGPAQREGAEMEKKGNKASVPCPDDACDRAVPLSPVPCVLPEQVCDIPAHGNPRALSSISYRTERWSGPTGKSECVLNTFTFPQSEMIS